MSLRYPATRFARPWTKPSHGCRFDVIHTASLPAEPYDWCCIQDVMQLADHQKAALIRLHTQQEVELAEIMSRKPQEPSARQQPLDPDSAAPPSTPVRRSAHVMSDTGMKCLRQCCAAGAASAGTAQVGCSILGRAARLNCKRNDLAAPAASDMTPSPRVTFAGSCQFCTDLLPCRAGACVGARDCGADGSARASHHRPLHEHGVGAKRGDTHTCAGLTLTLTVAADRWSWI